MCWKECYYEVDRRYKIELLTRLIDIHDLKLGIIFCNTKRMVDDLVDHLEAQGYMADRLHGDMTQAQRDRVMNKFRKSGLEFLVATDIAARGIDVDDVQVVFNYDLPYDGEDYVHRIGRTGRAGRAGRAISFVAGRELFQIRNIERYTNTRITRAKIPTANEVGEARANVFLEKLRATLADGKYEKQDGIIERLLEEGFVSTDIASALIHMLKGGEETPARAPRTEDYDRPPQREDRESHDSRFQNRPQRNDRYAQDDRRERTPYRDARVAAPPVAAKPTAPTPVVEAPVSEPIRHKKQITADIAVNTPKTFSDAEILAAIKPELREPLSFSPPETASKKRAKPERKTPSEQTRLHINIGEEMGVAPIDIVNSIAGETGLPGKVVGKIDIRERHLFVDVATEHTNAIIAKLNRASIKGQTLKVKLA